MQRCNLTILQSPVEAFKCGWSYTWNNESGFE